MDNDRDINMQDMDEFPNRGAENNVGNRNAMPSLQQRFNEARAIFDRNRMLFQEIDQNNKAREAGGDNRNIALIRELHNNTARLVNLYSDISSSFSRSLSKGSPRRH